MPTEKQQSALMALNQQLDVASLDENITDTTKKIIQEQSAQETQELVNMFNWHMQKKNIIRMMKLSKVEDIVIDSIIERFDRRPGEFNNDDLLHYLQTVESSIERAQKNMNNPENVAVPTINVQNNTQVNLNVIDKFTSDSKARITDAIKAFLDNAAANKDNPVVDADFFETDATDDETKGD